MDPHVANALPALIGAAVLILEDDDREEEENLIRMARIAVAEIIEMEEELEFDEATCWVPVTVFIDEYHRMVDAAFKLHFRMTRGVFELLTETLYAHLRVSGRIKRDRTPFPDIMLMVIWLLATPDSYRSVALRFGVAPSSLYHFYGYIIEALRELAPQYIRWPDAAEREEIKGTFQNATGFPGVIGCIDGTHVTITAPLRNPADYINRHHSFSINVQAVVDHDLLVRDLHVGEPGSKHDNRVFRRSPLCEKLSRGIDLNPEEHLVGDGGYTLTDYMMIPFQNNGHLTEQQLNFNKKLSQSRVRFENAFARAKGKWRRLKFLHARNEDIVVDHITACFVIHNFLILNGEVMLEEEELARTIPVNRVLGNEAEIEDENAEDVNAELEAAKARGVEKRSFISDYALE